MPFRYEGTRVAKDQKDDEQLKGQSNRLSGVAQVVEHRTGSGGRWFKSTLHNKVIIKPRAHV